ncbi:tyrosine--tRNA ligase [Phanerochaete sordida]|uniref:Tyrosine--tRNA ligase n=1 Tax=Phanerochaete sordida TaxID=48140 RepID=A0A9P3LHF7_9APHY|nr:tyrosine--tRNA ligase [Phanerochaete sordida]
MLQRFLLRRAHPSASVFRHVRAAHTESNVLKELESRGLVSQVSSPEKLRQVIAQPQVVYSGIDPTAKYLHVGHLLPLLCLFHFRLHGHDVIPLIGGATGLVGDPSGRNTERPLAESEVVATNVDHLVAGINKFFEGAIAYAKKRVDSAAAEAVTTPAVRNNLDWFQGIGLLQFLRTVGINARVNTMLARESVQTRLNSQQGISFTEFTYQLMQAYDYLHLHTQAGCSIQVGGSDQWGNIVAGIDLINRIAPTVLPDGSYAEKAFALTTPLLTTPSGEKFGKSAGNAVALDPDVTSVFDFYQFFLRTPDSHVGGYLKMFTLLPLPRIEAALAQHAQNPEARAAQRLLASEVTELIHGEHALHKAQIVTRLLYESDYASITTADVLHALEGDPRLKRCPRAELLGAPVVKLCAAQGLVASNGAARDLVKGKGLYANNRVVPSPAHTLCADDLIDGRIAILSAGSKRRLVLVADEA